MKTADELADGFRQEITRLRAMADRLEVAESALLGVEAPVALTVHQIAKQRDEAVQERDELAAALAKERGGDPNSVMVPVATLGDMRASMEQVQRDLEAARAALKDAAVATEAARSDQPAVRVWCRECVRMHPEGPCP